MLAVCWYLRFGLSHRDVEELLAERGIQVDHGTIFRWVQRFTPLLVDPARPHCCIERSPRATASTSLAKDDRSWARSSGSTLSRRPSMKESPHVAGLPRHIPAQCNSALPHPLAQGRSGSTSSWTTPTASSKVRWQPERTAVSKRSAITRCHRASTAREATSIRSAISGLVTGPRQAPLAARRPAPDQLDEPAGRAPARRPPGRWPVEVGGVPGLPPGPLPVPPPPVEVGDVLPELAWSWRSRASAFVRCGVAVLQIAQGALSSREKAAVGRLRHRLNEGTCGGPTSVRQPWEQQRPRVQIQ